MNRIRGIVTEELSDFGREFVKSGGVINIFTKLALILKS